jgi:two-component system, LuxR family, sensor kinase FixL
MPLLGSMKGSEVDFSLLESVPDAMLIVEGRTGTLIYVNGIAERLFGHPRSEIVGQAIELLLPDRFREAHRGHREGYARAPHTRSMGLGLALFGRKKSGEEFEAEISLSPLSIEGRTYSVAAVRDVTERRRIERTAQLYRRAQEEVRERDEFLSIASHELRTPVTALQLQLQMLSRVAERTQGELPGALRDKVDALERQTRRITLLVNELLDVSRMRLGRLDLKLEEVDLAELAREALAQLRAELERSGSRIALHAAGPALGRWDRLRVEQVLTNLLVNAVKFGEGKPIAVAVEADRESARLRVSDQGIGISPEHQSRVFGRFERAVSADHFGGLGLGLYIARQIVEAHGGTIELASAPGQGSTFTVELPKRPPAPLAPN